MGLAGQCSGETARIRTAGKGGVEKPLAPSPVPWQTTSGRREGRNNKLKVGGEAGRESELRTFVLIFTVCI